MAFQDLTGKTFGRWTVSRIAENRGNKSYWVCSCSCGTIKEVYSTHLRNGTSKSCGCLHREIVVEMNFKHGGRGTPEYTAWKNMISRCYNPKKDRYKDWGGRGIMVCEEWRNDFSAFLRHIGKRPSSKHSVDRIEVNGNYEPGNVRWATLEAQSHNQRLSKRNTTGVRGVKIRNDSGKYVASIGYKSKKIHLGTFDTIEEAILAREEAERTYW